MNAIVRRQKEIDVTWHPLAHCNAIKFRTVCEGIVLIQSLLCKANSRTNCGV